MKMNTGNMTDTINGAALGDSKQDFEPIYICMLEME